MTLYADSFDKSRFREWLRLMLGPEGQCIGANGYASSPVKKVAGFMSFRFLALTTDNSQWMRTGRRCRSYDELTRFADDHMIVQKILRCEHLNEDLASLFGLVGMDVPASVLDERQKKNTSPHLHHAEYYDEETTELVRRRERLIIDRFGYRA